MCRCAKPAGTYGDQRSTLSSWVALCLTTFKTYLYLFVLFVCLYLQQHRFSVEDVRGPIPQPIPHPHLRSPFPCHQPSIHAATNSFLPRFFFFFLITNQRKSKQVSKAFCYNSPRNFEKPYQAGNNRWNPSSPGELIQRKQVT